MTEYREFNRYRENLDMINKSLENTRRQFKLIKETIDDVIKTGEKARGSIKSITEVLPKDDVKRIKEDFEGLKGSLIGLAGDVSVPLTGIIEDIAEKARYAVDFVSVLVRLLTGQELEINADNDDNIKNTEKNVVNVGKTAKKTASEIKRALAGFDEINILKTGSGSEGGEIAADTLNEKKKKTNNNDLLFDMNFLKDKMKEKADMLRNEAERIKKIFEIGFEMGSGGFDFGRIFDGVEKIKNALKRIFLDRDITEGLARFIDNFVMMLGKVTGSAAYIGGVIGKTLIEGIGKYLVRNNEFIRERLKGILDSCSEIVYSIGELAAAAADIFSVFDNDVSSNIAANIIGIFANAFLGIVDLSGKLISDVLKITVNVISQNSEGIKTAVMTGILIPIEALTEGIKSLVTATAEKVFECYDTYIEPAFKNIENGISRITAALLQGYNEYIAPVIGEMAEKWKNFFEESLQPVIDNGIVLIGEMAEAFGELFNDVISPLAADFAGVIAPLIGNGIRETGETLLFMAKAGASAVNNLIGIMRGLVGFISGAFSGDWEKAWTSIGNIFKGQCQMFINILNAMIDKINGVKITMPKIGNVGGNVISFNIPKIPALAEGGIISSPMLAMIGEAGREAVIPLERNDGGTEMIAEKILQGMGKLQGGNTEITVKIGEEKILRKIIKGINRESMMRGRSVIV